MAFRCVWRWYDPRTWLVILLFVAPVARHTIAGRGGRIVFGSIFVLSGIIMLLDTAGAPLIRCADHTIARFLCGGTILVLFLFVVPAMSRWSSSVVRVVAILHTNKNQATHTHILTSICRVKAPRPGTIGRGAGRMRRSCSQFRLPIFTTRSNTHTDTISRRKRKQWKYRNGSSSKKISFVKNVTYSFATTSTVCSVFRYLNHRYHHHHHHHHHHPQQ